MTVPVELVAVTRLQPHPTNPNIGDIDAIRESIRANDWYGTIVEPDDVPETAPAITKPGDLWLLGDHRVLCGDCRDSTEVARLVDGATMNLAFTSPPYADRRKYDEQSGFKPIPPGEYVEWFTPVAANVAANLAPDGSWFVNIKPGVSADGIDTETYAIELVLAHVREWGWHWATEFCWARRGVPKAVARRFKNQFEPIYQFTRGDWKIRPEATRRYSERAITPFGPGAGNTSWGDSAGNGGRIGKQGQKRRSATSRSMSDVQWSNSQPGEYIGPGMAYPGNMLPVFQSESNGHPAAFPVDLPRWFIQAYTDPGDTVFDPFAGSGSTILAAHHEQRIGYGIELSATYVDVTCKRFQTATGIVPVLESSGEPHDFAIDLP